jgi:hypothetical protein
MARAQGKVKIFQGENGALGKIRTPNLLIRSQMLYPLSYERLRRALLDDRKDDRKLFLPLQAR